MAAEALVSSYLYVFSLRNFSVAIWASYNINIKKFKWSFAVRQSKSTSNNNQHQLHPRVELQH
jgi:hypothetical protein